MVDSMKTPRRRLRFDAVDTGVKRVAIGSAWSSGYRSTDTPPMQCINSQTHVGSKSISAEITQSAVELKVLIEQMREQIQNIE